MTRTEIAEKLREQGYNCAQAVACAFSDVLGADADTVYKIAEGFGGGMGNNEYVCGAVSAAIIIAGLKSSNGINEPSNKANTYSLASEITEEFKKKFLDQITSLNYTSVALQANKEENILDGTTTSSF